MIPCKGIFSPGHPYCPAHNLCDIHSPGPATRLNFEYMGLRTLFDDDIPKPRNKRPGRDPKLQANKDECIADRYYYYSRIKRLNYQAILEELSREFFLSNFQLQERMRMVWSYLVKLKNQPLSLEDLADKWPWMVWE